MDRGNVAFYNVIELEIVLGVAWPPQIELIERLCCRTALRLCCKTHHGMASSSKTKKKNTIRLTVPWGPNSIIVDPASIKVKYDTRDRRDASKRMIPHVALPSLGDVDKNALDGEEFQLANLHSYEGPYGIAYMWDVVGLNAHFTVAWTPYGQPLPPLEDFDFKGEDETNDMICGDVDTNDDDQNQRKSGHADMSPLTRSETV